MSWSLSRDAQNIRQAHDHLSGHLRAEAHQRGDRVQRVEEKMRIDLALQRVESRLQQQPLLFLELVLDADRVPYLQLNANHHRRAGVDRQPHRPGRRDQRKKAVG